MKAKTIIHKRSLTDQEIKIINDDKVLMVRTQSGSKLIYNFPGGGVENNEGFAQALTRECLEEIKVNVMLQKQLYSSKNL